MAKERKACVTYLIVDHFVIGYLSGALATRARAAEPVRGLVPPILTFFFPSLVRVVIVGLVVVGIDGL